MPVDEGAGFVPSGARCLHPTIVGRFFSSPLQWTESQMVCNSVVSRVAGLILRSPGNRTRKYLAGDLPIGMKKEKNGRL